MKQLIPMDEYGVFADTKDTVRANSLQVAEMFDKNHKNVLRDIQSLDCSEEFNRLNFEPISYKDKYGRKQKAVAMTRDGFVFLVMGYRGKKAAQFKEAYIRRFNEMERFVQSIVETRRDYPLLAEHISLLHENPRPYHYSNEADMLNRLVIGMTAKQFRELHGIEKGKSIRPHLTEEQINRMNVLQKVDLGLMMAMPDYESRKRQLEWYVQKMWGLKIA